MTEEFAANEHQNTPSSADLEAQLAADEASRAQPEEVTTEAQSTPEPESPDEQIEETHVEKEDKDDDYQKRISRIAFEKRKAEKEARDLRERIAQLEGKAPRPPQEEEMLRQIEAKALKMAEMKAYNDRADTIYKEGVSQFGDFAQKIGELNQMGVISRELVESADETGEPAKVLYFLSKNLDEAERISSLGPHKMGVALGKLAAKLSAPPPPKAQSKAPPPIKPVSGAPKRDMGIMEMSLEDFMRQEDDKTYRRQRGMR